jgi:hypothetical protein
VPTSSATWRSMVFVGQYREKSALGHGTARFFASTLKDQRSAVGSGSGHPEPARPMSQLGGYLPLAPVVSTVRYPIPERIFDYVSAVQSATAGTCHEPTSALAVQSPSRRGRVRVGGIPRAFDKARAFHLPVSLLVNATREAT